MHQPRQREGGAMSDEAPNEFLRLLGIELMLGDSDADTSH